MSGPNIAYTKQFVDIARINGRTLIFNENGLMKYVLYGTSASNLTHIRIKTTVDPNYTIFESDAFREWFIGCFVPILVCLFIGTILCIYTARSIIKRDQEEQEWNDEMNQQFENQRHSQKHQHRTRRQSPKKSRTKSSRKSKRSKRSTRSKRSRKKSKRHTRMKRSR